MISVKDDPRATGDLADALLSIGQAKLGIQAAISVGYNTQAQGLMAVAGPELTKTSGKAILRRSEVVSFVDVYSTSDTHSQADLIVRRLAAALQDVLPSSTTFKVLDVVEPATAIVRIGSHRLLARWVGRGSVRTVNQALMLRPRADILVGSELSLGAGAAASRAGVGWVDESGAAEIAAGAILVSRTGRPRHKPARQPGWTTAVLSITEAILCGTKATVSATAAATGHSMSSTARALAMLGDFGLLEASADRGRHSGRRVIDRDRLLDQYAEAALRLRPAAQLRCGVLWRDPLIELDELGAHWERAGVRWAATGSLGAAILAPYLTEIGGGEVYVEASSEPALRNAARHVGVEPMEGGRLLLRPFPTAASERLATRVGGVTVAPWPRVYADLREVGVRGEEAAEYLRETMCG